MASTSVFIVGAKRTAFGAFGASLAKIRYYGRLSVLMRVLQGVLKARRFCRVVFTLSLTTRNDGVARHLDCLVDCGSQDTDRFDVEEKYQGFLVRTSSGLQL